MAKKPSRRQRKASIERQNKYDQRPSALRRKGRRSKKAEAKKRSRLSSIAWAAAATFSTLLLAGYATMAITLGVAQPFIPTVGVSMNPTIYQGSLAIVESVPPETIKVGDIIAVGTTEEARAAYGVPATVLHRVVGIAEGNAGLVFTTQGDNPVTNGDPDPYKTIARNVIGKTVTVIPGVGWVPLVLGGVWGKYLGAAIVLIIVIYWLLSLRERRIAAAAAQTRLIEELSVSLAAARPGSRGVSHLPPMPSPRRRSRRRAGRRGQPS